MTDRSEAVALDAAREPLRVLSADHYSITMHVFDQPQRRGTHCRVCDALTSLAALRPEKEEAGLRRVSEELESVRQAALSARSIAEPVWQERNDPWVPLRALDSAMTGLPCPVRSSLTDQPCVLTLWHPSDGIRFHRFARAVLVDR